MPVQRSPPSESIRSKSAIKSIHRIVSRLRSRDANANAQLAEIDLISPPASQELKTDQNTLSVTHLHSNISLQQLTYLHI